MTDTEAPAKMESLNRVAQIPIVESTVNLCCNMYGKVKDSNEYVNSVLVTAEEKMKVAAATAQPYAAKLEGPMKKVDSLLCSSLDFVEEKVPAIKLPPGEMYETTKTAISSKVEPAINAASAMAAQGVQKVASLAANLTQQQTQQTQMNDGDEINKNKSE